MNKDVKKMIFRRQLIYFFILLCLDLPYTTFAVLMSYLTHFVSAQDTRAFMLANKQLYGVASTAYFLRALILPVIRLVEPQTVLKVLNPLTRTLRSYCYGQNNNNNDTEVLDGRSFAASESSANSVQNLKKMLQLDEDDPNIVFLSSSLNNMLVCGILKGINLSLEAQGSK